MTLLGHSVEAVQIERDCGATSYYFDPHTFDLRMTEFRVPTHARGDAVDRISIIRQFSTVRGVRVPSRLEEIDASTGDVLEGAEWTSIEGNIITDKKIFDPPEVHPAGITAVVLQMLTAADHSTPSEMMTIYTVFRASDEGSTADVFYDMNWLGFELLKVDRYDYALPVFQKMIDETPSNAAAWAGIGEAYLQKRDASRAKDAFEHALSLGLNDDDVRRKLMRLQAQAN